MSFWKAELVVQMCVVCSISLWFGVFVSYFYFGFCVVSPQKITSRVLLEFSRPFCLSKKGSLRSLISPPSRVTFKL